MMIIYVDADVGYSDAEICQAEEKCGHGLPCWVATIKSICADLH
jgi:hypothetical protein